MMKVQKPIRNRMNGPKDNDLNCAVLFPRMVLRTFLRACLKRWSQRKKVLFFNSQTGRTPKHLEPRHLRAYPGMRVFRHPLRFLSLILLVLVLGKSDPSNSQNISLDEPVEKGTPQSSDAETMFPEPAHDAELRRRLAGFRERIRTSDPTNSIPDLSFEALGLLRSLAGEPVSNNEWNRLSAFPESLSNSITELELALEAESAKTVFSVIPATDTTSGLLALNPWGGIDQETHYQPRFSNLKYWTGSPALTPVPPSLHDSIPSRYRLAEMLGLGTNQVHIELSFIDAKLFTAIDYGFDITQRIRHDVTGSFQLQETGVSVETFRRMIESKSRIGTREIDLGPEVKPHKVGFRSISPSDAANSVQGTRAWEQERLDQRLALESRPVGPSASQQNDEHQRNSAINEAISRKLESLQETVIAAQTLFLEESPMAERLDNTIAALQAWETSHSDSSSCLIRPMSPRLIGKQMLEKQIVDQGKSNSAIQLDELLPEQIRAATLTMAHGLLHRVPEAVQPVALEIFTAMLQSLPSHSLLPGRKIGYIPRDPRRSRRKEAHSILIEGSQSHLTSVPTVQRFKAREVPKR